MGWDLTIPVVGKATLDHTRSSFLQRYSSGVNANFSIARTNGSVGAVSSNPELTLALGAARMGANAWMQSGGDRTKYDATREAFMKIMQAGKIAAAASLNTPLMDFYTAQMVNFDKGAATASGYQLNSVSARNTQIVNKALAENATNGDLVNTKNEQLSPSLGSNTLQGVGYGAAQQQRRTTTPTPTVGPR
jgi:hypothetical protein